MQTILWLPSWYPNKTGPFDGDFVQRLARAASLYARVHVLFVVKDASLQQPVLTVKKQEGNLHETIVYYQPCWLGKITAWTHYFTLYRKCIKQYIREHGLPDCIHVQVPLKAGMVALWCRRRYGIPYVLTEHNGIYNDILPDRFSERSFYFKHYTKKVIRNAALFIPVSRALGEAINNRVTATPYTVIPNTVNVKYFHYQPSAAAAKFRFIHVSNMVALKNVQGIINACARLQKEYDFEVVLIGGYPPDVYDHAAGTGLINTVLFFKGEVPYETVAQEMQQSHAFVLFSNTENMPCVVLEALCCGLPVIATAVGGVPEVINEFNGILVQPGHETALLNAMRNMIQQYQLYNRGQIAENAIQQFSYEAIGEKINSRVQLAIDNKQ